MTEILSHGMWSDYSCAARPFLMGKWGFIISASLISLYFGEIAIISLIGLKIKKDVPRLQELRTIVPYLPALIFCIIAIAVMVPTVSRTETMVFIEGNDIVSTGCRLGRPYREIAHFKDVTVQILHHMKDRYEPEYYLIALRWPHQRDSLYAGLDSPLLARLTPEAVANYVKQLQSKHLPIPPKVQRLIDKTNNT